MLPRMEKESAQSIDSRHQPPPIQVAWLAERNPDRPKYRASDLVGRVLAHALAFLSGRVCHRWAKIGFLAIFPISVMPAHGGQSFLHVKGEAAGMVFIEDITITKFCR